MEGPTDTAVSDPTHCRLPQASPWLRSGAAGPALGRSHGDPTCRRGGLVPPSPSGQNSGEEGSPCSFGPAKPPMPSAQLSGEHPAWGAAQEPLPSPGLSQDSPRRLRERGPGEGD